MKSSFNKIQDQVFDIKIKYMFQKNKLKRELVKLKHYIANSEYYNGNKKKAYKFINAILKE